MIETKLPSPWRKCKRCGVHIVIGVGHCGICTLEINENFVPENPELITFGQTVRFVRRKDKQMSEQAMMDKATHDRQVRLERFTRLHDVLAEIPEDERRRQINAVLALLGDHDDD